MVMNPIAFPFFLQINLFDTNEMLLGHPSFFFSDLDVFLTMALALWPHHSRDELAKEFDRIMRAPQETGFICRKNGKAIGFITMSLRFGHITGATSKPVGY